MELCETYAYPELEFERERESTVFAIHFHVDNVGLMTRVISVISI